MFNKLMQLFEAKAIKPEDRVKEECCKCHRSLPFTIQHFTGYIDNVKIPLAPLTVKNEHKPDDVDVYCRDCPNPNAKIKCKLCSEVKPANQTYFTPNKRMCPPFDPYCKICNRLNAIAKVAKDKLARGEAVVPKQGLNIYLDEQSIDLKAEYCVWQDKHTLLINLEKMYHAQDNDPNFKRNPANVRGTRKNQFIKINNFNIFDADKTIPVKECKLCGQIYVVSKNIFDISMGQFRSECRPCRNQRRAELRKFKIQSTLNVKIYKHGNLYTQPYKVTSTDEEVKIVFNQEEEV